MVGMFHNVAIDVMVRSDRDIEGWCGVSSRKSQIINPSGEIILLKPQLSTLIL